MQTVLALSAVRVKHVELVLILVLTNPSFPPSLPPSLPPPSLPGILLRPDLQGNLRVCKECHDIFQEFHTSKMKQEANGNQLTDSQATDGSLSPRSLTAMGTPTKSQTGDPQQFLQPSDSPVGRGGSGNFGGGRTSRPLNILGAQKSWDNASSGRSSQEIVDLSPSHLQTNVEFDNPTPIRSLSGRKQSSLGSLQQLPTETDERLLALEEVRKRLACPGSSLID